MMFHWLGHFKTIETHHVLINLYLFQNIFFIAFFAGPENKTVDLTLIGKFPGYELDQFMEN